MGPEAAERQKKKEGRKRKVRIEEAVQFALAHHIRLEILILLNESAYTALEISELTDIQPNKVSNHLLEMLADRSIEVAKKRRRSGRMVYWYRAIELPEYTKEQAEGLSEAELQQIAGVIAQSQTAELMAALHKGTLATPRTILSWDLYDLDGQAREDVEDVTTQYLERLREIQCESMNRVAESGQKTTPLIVTVGAFERAREIRVPPARRCDPPAKSD